VIDLSTSIIYTATGDGGTALGIGATDLLNLSGAIVLPGDGPPALPSEPISMPLPSESAPERPARTLPAVAATAS